MTTKSDLDLFYSLMTQLAEITNGMKLLSNCDGQMNWPTRGIYFFFEKGEIRNNGDMRVVRVGTHALKTGSKTTLWNRLRQHRGNIGGVHPGGGNHRGSIFRLHVGTAIISKEQLDIPTWSIGSTAKSDVREEEYSTECLVSNYICSMPFLWIDIDDLPGPNSDRGFIERNAIALLSNFNRDNPIDPPSESWLGHYALNDKIKCSGLWNVNHVDEIYDPDFLKVLERYVEDMK